MRLSTFSFLCSIASAFDLSNLLAGEYIHESSTGAVSMSFFNLGEALKKRDYEDIPSVKINSLDNANTLQAIKDQLENNAELGTGERIYMESVFLHNGYPETVNDLTTGEFADYLFNVKSLSQEDVAVLIKGTNDNGVKALLEGAHSKPQSIDKRDRVQCGGRTNFGGNQCGTLMDRIGGKGCISGSWCVGNCCASWSEFRCFNDDVINGLVQRCREACIFGGRSCKIFGANMAGFTRNFCLGPTAGCKR